MESAINLRFSREELNMLKAAAHTLRQVDLDFFRDREVTQVEGYLIDSKINKKWNTIIKKLGVKNGKGSKAKASKGKG